jgi:sterol desaturase/sphingolipid hydroxylase (fatty acid hydroxylase superfamily)
MIMAMSVVLFILLRDVGDKLIIATLASVWGSLFFIIILERVMPFNSEWKPSLKDYITDGIYLLFVQTLLPQILVWMAALGLLAIMNGSSFQVDGLWPHNWPLWAQGLLIVFLSDLLRYWLHRLSHTIPILWRLHAVHHSVTKMYWLNTSRFHPIEKALQFLMDVFPFMLLGVSEDVIALHLVVYGVNGFFQHCNIDLKFGWLNYIVSSTEHHRWHHSKEIHESNRNYGNNVIVWDIIFGSYFLPKNKSVKTLGLINPDYPSSFARQLFSPFKKNLDKAQNRNES